MTFGRNEQFQYIASQLKFVQQHFCMYLPNKLSMTFYYKLLQKPKNLYKTHGVKTFARFFHQIKKTAPFFIRILPISSHFFVKMMEKTQFSRIPRKIRQIDENFIDLTEKRCFIANFTLY